MSVWSTCRAFLVTQEPRDSRASLDLLARRVTMGLLVRRGRGDRKVGLV